MNLLHKTTVLFVSLALALWIVGCSGGAGPIAPSGPQGLSGQTSNLSSPTIAGSQTGLTGKAKDRTIRTDRAIWGIYNITIDPSTLEATVEPNRDIATHVNVTTMVTPPNCKDCLGIKVLGVDPVTHIYRIQVSLKNPTKALTGYDVRGTLLFPAGDNRELVNADDWTTWFDNSTPADINPFMTFAKDQAQRAFGPLKVYYVEYDIKFPPPANLSVLFVVDASWPANEEEVYTIDNIHFDGGMNECNSAEGWLYCDINDWQVNATGVTLDLTPLGGTSSVVNMENVANKTYRAYLNNEVGAAAGDYRLLFSAYSANTTYACYDYYKLTVATCTNTPPQWDTIGIQQLKSIAGGLQVIYGTATDTDSPVTYNIYYSIDKPIEWTTAAKINDPDGTPFNLMGLSDSHTYWVGVRAVDSLGNEEKNTKQLSGVPSNPPVWDTTVGITGVIVKNHEIDVTYGTAHDPQTPVTYNVYWSDTTPIDFGTANKLNDTGTPTEVTGLDNFKTYHFAVRAMDAFGSEDQNTKELPGIPNGPPEWVGPIGIQLTLPGDQTVTVTYGTANDIDLPIKYNIYWSDTTPINFSTANKAVDADGSPFTVGSLINGKTYHFAVRAEDSTGVEEGNLVELPGTPNSAPTWQNGFIGVQSLIPQDKQVIVAYGHALDPDQPITYYIYYSKTSPINFGTAAYVTTTSESPKTVTGLDNFVPYFFAVRAQDSVGIMEQNTVTLSTIPNPAPVWNTTIGIQALDAQNQSLVAHYGTAHDIDTPVTYRVYYQDTTPINFATALHIDDDASPTTIPGLVNGKKYYAAVRARDSFGNEETNIVTMSQTPQALPVEVWSKFTGGVVQCSPMMIDLNNDSILDIVVGDQSNKMVAYSGVDGSPIWTFPTGGWVDSSAALADENGDGVRDVIFGSLDKNVYCVNGVTGAEIWHATTTGGIISSPSLANISGDFHLDVVVGSEDGKLYAFNGANGAAIWNFPTGGIIFSSPANTDLTGDSIPDFVVGSQDGNVYAVNGANGAQIWSFPIGDWVNSSPALTDINGDTVPDAIIGALDGNVYALNGVTGAQIWKFPTGSYIWTSPSLAKINGDNVPDVVLGADSSNIYAIDGVTGTQIWTYPSQGRIWSSAAMVDLNGDNIPEAVVGSDDGFLYGIDGATGSALFSFPTGDWIDSSPCVGDIDNDGQIDIAFGRYDGYVTIVESQGAVIGLTPWPMFRHDYSHTAKF